MQELGFGFYDAFTGVVTQPIDGMKNEGWPGLWKGIGLGVGGLVLKPIAGTLPSSPTPIPSHLFLSTYHSHSTFSALNVG
jgi:hypothetical protein